MSGLTKPDRKVPRRVGVLSLVFSLLVVVSPCRLVAQNFVAGAVKSPVSQPQANPVPRWRFSVLDLESSLRFNYMDQKRGTVLSRSGQYRLRLRSRFDLRANGHTWLQSRAETGRGFDNSWNNTGAGLGDGQTVFNLKSIAIVQQWSRHVEFQAGGIDFERGAGGDETYVSGDGYTTGYRLSVAHLARRLPDKLSVTASYVGAFDKPNVFSRFRMDRANYVQVLAQHGFGTRLDGSAEFDELYGASYNREAVRYHHLGPIDDAMVEVVMRTSAPFTFGWSTALNKDWNGKWHANLQYSDLPSKMYVVDGQRVFFNRGEIDIGKHFAGEASRKLTRNCQIGVFAGRQLDSTPSKRWVAQVGVSYQYSSLLNGLLR